MRIRCPEHFKFKPKTDDQKPKDPKDRDKAVSFTGPKEEGNEQVSQ